MFFADSGLARYEKNSWLRTCGLRWRVICIVNRVGRRLGVEIDLRTADWPKKVSSMNPLRPCWISWRMSACLKTGHGCKQDKHRQVDAPGNRVSAGDVRAHAAPSKHGRKQQLGADRHKQRQEPDFDAYRQLLRQQEPTRHVPGGEIDDHEHDRHFSQLCQALADTRDEKGNAHRTQNDASTENQ